MTDDAIDTIDFFTDREVGANPYPWFEHLRARCPVAREPVRGTLAVTGYDEALEVYRNTDDFSSCNSAIGPFAPLPGTPEGDDISDYIAEHRDQLPMHEHFVTMDPPEHTRHRSLLMRLLTPRRMRDNEQFMWDLAGRQLDEFAGSGSGEFISGYAQPFALLVVADLLGVPAEHHDLLRRKLGYQRPGEMSGKGAASTAEDHQWDSLNPLEFLDEYFISYIEQRRREPRDDVLTQLALATFPDGNVPDPVEVSRIATFLFGAGQETTARLLASAVMILAEHPEIQQRLRADRSLVANFVEETLRFESPVKADFRLARRSTTLGGVDVPAGTCVMLLNGAANRDPRQFTDPATFDLERHGAAHHMAFGRGAHSCPGGPLARAEGRISIERILDRMGDIRISEAHHGPPGRREFRWEPTYILRGLRRLHVEWVPLEQRR
jgi:cytochrome P450